MKEHAKKAIKFNFFIENLKSTFIMTIREDSGIFGDNSWFEITQMKNYSDDGIR